MVPDHPESVATNWSLSFIQVQERSAAAADLLRVCAFLHPDAIPEELITEGAAALGPDLQAVAQSPLAFNQAIGVLLSYSLLKRNAEEHLLSIHRLVQAVLKDGMDVRTSRDWAERVVQAVNDALPDVDYRTYTRYERCLPHAQECAQLIEQEQFTSDDARRILNQTGVYLWRHARYAEAEASYQQSLRIGEQTLGPDHPDVASPLNNLAILYYEQGKYTKAEPLYQRALRIYEQALGPDDPLVAYPLLDLGSLYYMQSKYAEAEPLYQRALRIREQALGPDHPDVAYPLYGLANLYYDQGQYAEAEPLYQRALRIMEHTLGHDHPEVATPLLNLGSLYYVQGKYAEAEPLYQRALRIWEQTFGPGHPLTRTVARNYAILLRKMGREAEALQLEVRFPADS